MRGEFGCEVNRIFTWKQGIQHALHDLADKKKDSSVESSDFWHSSDIGERRK